MSTDPRAEDAPPSSTRRLRVLGDRPKTRGDCVDGARPCPWVSCRHHLFLDVDRRGFVRLSFSKLEEDQRVRLEEMSETCSLDVADRERTLEDVGALIGVTREGARLVEVAALKKLADGKHELGLFLEGEGFDSGDGPHLGFDDPDAAEAIG